MDGKVTILKGEMDDFFLISRSQFHAFTAVNKSIRSTSSCTGLLPSCHYHSLEFSGEMQNNEIWKKNRIYNKNSTAMHTSFQMASQNF